MRRTRRQKSLPIALRLLALGAAVVPVYFFAAGVDKFITAFQIYFESEEKPITIYTDATRLREETWRRPPPDESVPPLPAPATTNP